LFTGLSLPAGRGCALRTASTSAGWR